MAFASSSGGGSGPMADINVTPLVDVMLVLLIIFMVTMPIQSVPVDVDLPQKTQQSAAEAEGTAGADQLAHRCCRPGVLEQQPTPVNALQTMMKTEVERDPTNQPDAGDRHQR
jgi:biopolymer transport protein ExbD